jgi:hypothetical protein
LRAYLEEATYGKDCHCSLKLSRRCCRGQQDTADEEQHLAQHDEWLPKEVALLVLVVQEAVLEYYVVAPKLVPVVVQPLGRPGGEADAEEEEP